MKNPYVTCVALCLLVILGYSCRKVFLNEVVINPKVEWAKEYFTQTLVPNEGNVLDPRVFAKSEFLSSLKQNSGSNMEIPIWQKAMEWKTAKYDYVEIPLKYTRKVTTIIKTDPATAEAVDPTILKGSIDRLIIYKDKNGKVDQRIISFVPSKAYLDRHKGDISHNRIGKLDKDFEGMLIYKEWNGTFLIALVYVEGKLFKIIKKSKNSKIKKIAFQGEEENCTTYYLYHWEVTCYFEGDNVVPTYCDEPVVTVVDQWEVCEETPTDPCAEPENFENPECHVDCAGVIGGAAEKECGYCIGGTTGLSSPSQLGDSPSTGATASIAQVSPSGASISKLGNDWGYTDVETVDLTIGASLDSCVWTAVLISAKGNYSLQARLLSGCTEITGNNTTSSNYCDQLYNLKTFGNGNKQWYMLSAVVAHENVHETRLEPGLNAALADIEADVKTLTVPATGQTKAQAISQLRALAGFTTVKGGAKVRWDTQYTNLILNDHGSAQNGPAYMAESATTNSVGISICNLKTSHPSWPGCSHCPY